MAEPSRTDERLLQTFRAEETLVDLPPARVGDYELRERLGRGSQAEVFRAVHAVRGTEAVVKLARERAPSGEDPLHAEARLLGGLDQPGLARVLESGEYLGRPYLVLEYVGGQTLAAWRQGRALSADEAVRVVARLARALAVVHDRGVVHRDLKPANVLIDPAGRPVVIDFGAALSGDQEGPPPLLGTPAYLAPEQLSGPPAHSGPRSDVFGLGGVLYFLLTGKAPFAGGSVRETFTRAAGATFDEEALARSGAPAEVQRICRKALAFDPADRFASAEELAGHLERSLARRRWLAPFAALRKFVRAVFFRRAP